MDRFTFGGVVDGAEFTCVAGGSHHGAEPVRSRSRRDYRSPNRTGVVGRICEDMSRGVVKEGVSKSRGLGQVGLPRGGPLDTSTILSHLTNLAATDCRSAVVSYRGI